MVESTTANPTVSDRLNGIIAAVLDVDRETLAPDTQLADLQADTLELYDIVLRAEEAFGIHLSDADVEHARTVGDLAALVERGCRS